MVFRSLMNAEGDIEREVGEIKRKNSQVKDPNVKLFGKSIELPGNFSAVAAAGICDAGGEGSSIQDFTCSSNSVFGESGLNGDAEDLEANKGQIGQNQDDAKEENPDQSLMSDELKDDPKAQSNDIDVGAEQNTKAEEDQSGTKCLKKPDKILPCPRCNSMDTKFCYFNNYNANQPRHFCKNCHRYWTAGGTMRNMPVGAGRRKNKHNAAASQSQNLPEALPSTRMDLPNGNHHPVTALNPNETIITYTSDTPQCESMATVSHESKETGDDHSVPNEEGKTGIPELTLNCHPFPQQVPCFPGAPWPWQSVQWCAPPSVPPTFPPASFPLPFYSTPPPYWGWNVPWFIPPTPMPLNLGPDSPTLGKHSRDDDGGLKPEEETGKEEKREKCLWVPKTLRICDPKEAAKSSIWATLGIKHDRADSVDSGGGSGLFKAFQRQTKGEEKTTHVPETATVLQANPAALSRSLNFHESS